MKPFYITTPIYYVNDKPHIGHAYTTIAADVLARWKRLKKERVFFLTGTDEHGSKIAQAAESAGVSPQDYVDRLSREFQSLWKILNISNDDFIRTTEPRHQSVVQSVFKNLYDQDEIYKGFYEDWYCIPCESFWLESQLADKKCPECGKPVEKIKEESYFFKLSKYGERLISHYKKNPNFLSPANRAQEMIRFVEGGLKDLSVSRIKEKWGVPVPFDTLHTTYVWFDALLNYLSAAGYGYISKNKNSSESPEPRATNPDFKEIWPCDIHFMGKEIFRFHGVIWPSILIALHLPLPKKVFAHGWWTVEGEKMSKSRGNVVDPREIVQDFSVDSFRYFLLREMPFGADGDFSKKALLTRYNSELANDLGNLFSRVLTLIEKNFSGAVSRIPKGTFLPSIENANRKIAEVYEEAAFHEVLNQIVEIVRQANRYLERKAPWALAKTNPAECEKVLTETLVVLRWLAAAYSPFMPQICLEMWRQIGEEKDLVQEGWDTFSNPLKTFSPGKRVHKDKVLFPRKS